MNKKKSEKKPARNVKGLNGVLDKLSNMKPNDVIKRGLSKTQNTNNQPPALLIVCSVDVQRDGVHVGYFETHQISPADGLAENADAASKIGDSMRGEILNLLYKQR